MAAVKWPILHMCVSFERRKVDSNLYFGFKKILLDYMNFNQYYTKILRWRIFMVDHCPWYDRLKVGPKIKISLNHSSRKRFYKIKKNNSKAHKVNQMACAPLLLFHIIETFPRKMVQKFERVYVFSLPLTTP